MRVMRAVGDTEAYQILKIRPLTGALGAEISGVDLSKPLSGQAREEIKRALYDYLVIYFHDQVGLSRERHLEVAQMFGPLQRIPHIFSVDGYPDVQIVRRERVHIFQLRCRGVYDLMQRVKRIFSLESPLSRGRLKENAAKREDVGTVIDLVHATTRLLGRHVPDSAHHHSRR